MRPARKAGTEMTVRVHYGHQSFIVKGGDPASLAKEAFDILTREPERSGIWNLETSSGEVYLLLNRAIPVAVEDFDDGMQWEPNSMDFPG